MLKKSVASEHHSKQILRALYSKKSRKISKNQKICKKKKYIKKKNKKKKKQEKKKKCYPLSFPVLGGHDSTRALQSSLFQKYEKLEKSQKFTFFNNKKKI